MRTKKANMLLAVLAAVGIGLARAFCPDKCQCDDAALTARCIKAGLSAMPNALNPGLKTIVYKYNDFPTVDVSLKFLSMLERVDLSHNKIVTLPDGSFSRQSRLRQLNLEGNRVSRLSNETFYGLSQLEVLNLRGNLIEELPPGTFRALEKVEELFLEKNRISSIAPTAFTGILVISCESIGLWHIS